MVLLVHPELDRFTGELRDYCRRHVLEEKWLLAPTMRIGFQWVDRVARSGQPVVNLRVKTLRHLALELAAPGMEQRGLRFLRGAAAEVLVGRVLTKLKAGRPGYLLALEPSLGLVRAIHGALRDLRLAGVTVAGIEDGRFEVTTKGREMQTLLAAYEGELNSRRLFDHADLLAEAAARLRESGESLLAGKLVILPQDQEIELRGLERRLWEATPAGCRAVLEVDWPGEQPEGTRTDTGLLRWLLSPAVAPVAAGDGSAGIFRAVGEANEVREVLRRCIEGKIPFDQVEILHTDRDTYVPLIYELVWRLQPEDMELPPVTFSEGIPPRYSRPARCLMGWLSWIREDYPQSVLARMIQDGLLEIGEAGREGTEFSRLARLLRGLPVGNGRDRYLEVIDREIDSLRNRAGETGVLLQGRRRGDWEEAETEGDTETGAEPDTAGEIEIQPDTEKLSASEPGSTELSERLEELRAIRSLIVDLLGWAGTRTEAAEPEDPIQGVLPGVPADSVPSPEESLFQGALSLLQKRGRRMGKFDEYAYERLTKEIRILMECLRTGGHYGPSVGRARGGRASDRGQTGPAAKGARPGAFGFDAAEWLSDLVRSSQIFGMRPQPGCLHVDHLDSGGHSGRPYTFVLGLDDTRFPGSGVQDPVLLDRERGRISPELPTAGRRLAGRIEGFARLLARLRGNVTLSYCCRNLAEDREMFPSPLLLSAYRILSGHREGDLRSFIRWLPEPASFAPHARARCLDSAEWWLWRLCGTDQEVSDPEEAVGSHFPHLKRGSDARKARQSDRFTEYDGYVPEAGRDLDPFRPGGPVLSASRLEKLGACPLEYFFRYVLEIKPPDDYEIDPRLWLDPQQKGELLHKAFRQFMSDLQREGLLPEFDRDWVRLEALLEDEIGAWQQKIAPPNREVFERERRDLKLTGRIFLLEEEEFCRQVRPRFFEVAVGLPPEGSGSVLDCEDPVAIRLPGGKSIRVRGRIDRVDELPGPKAQTEFAVWDYKTGSAWRYLEGRGKRRADPFDQGRLTQGILYLSLAEARLREKISSRAKVVRFGYFFPSVRAHGERLIWQVGELAGGREVIEGLCRMLASGCFPFSDQIRDVTWSDYEDAFGDKSRALKDAKRKFENPLNAELEPIRRLRGYAEQA